eukprot:5368062-Pleurochrysis_carterae.AAC.2
MGSPAARQSFRECPLPLHRSLPTLARRCCALCRSSPPQVFKDDACCAISVHRHARLVLGGETNA